MFKAYFDLYARKTDDLHALYKLSRYRLYGYLFIVILFGKI